jgi:SAM-dependent methyltransferase
VSEGAAGGYDPALHAQLAPLEAESFWFQARNKLVVAALRRHFPAAGSFLEVGCGNGVVLEAIAAATPHLRLGGVDLFEAALETARRRVPTAELVQADMRSLSFEGGWDVVGAFDVLEHIEEDGSVLGQIRRALRPGGGLIALVPQHRWLWSEADVVARHVRRYTRRELLAKVRAAGFAPLVTTSFVSLPLPLLIAARLRSRIAPRTYDLRREILPGPVLNTALARVLDLERALYLAGVRLPAGGSLLVVARAL